MPLYLLLFGHNLLSCTILEHDWPTAGLLKDGGVCLVATMETDPWRDADKVSHGDPAWSFRAVEYWFKQNLIFFEPLFWGSLLRICLRGFPGRVMRLAVGHGSLLSPFQVRGFFWGKKTWVS